MSEKPSFEMEAVAKRLNVEIDKTIAVCRKKENLATCKHWLEKFFVPAKEALNERGRALPERLTSACVHLNVFGGMGSWSDVRPDDSGTDGLYDAYIAAKQLAG